MTHSVNRILIIDDEIDICFILNHYLNKENFLVDKAHSLKDGLEKMKSFNPQILFLDISLPDGSGLNSIKIIKKILPEVKISIISAYDSAEDIEKAKNAGADSYITKPFTRAIIMNTIEDFLLK